MIFREEQEINDILERFGIENDDLTMMLVNYIREKKAEARKRMADEFIAKLENMGI